jgi:hypothetical protein
MFFLTNFIYNIILIFNFIKTKIIYYLFILLIKIHFITVLNKYSLKSIKITTSIKIFILLNLLIS